MRIDLSDRTALVTGAGSGIGRACAEALAGAGAFVWVNDLRWERADPVAQRVGGQALPGDVADPGPWLQPAIDRGVLHILVHNAGYDLETGVGETDRSDFDRILRVQLSGPFEMTQRLLVPLKRAGDAVVVFIASVHGLATLEKMSAYASAKGGLISMVRAMAQDLGPSGIRVVAVSPGWIDTPMIRDWFDSRPDPARERAFAEGLHPLGQMGQPEDVAHMVTFLASPMARFINATNLVVDGGLTARLYNE